MKKYATRSSETVVTTYKATWRQCLEHHQQHFHGSENCLESFVRKCWHFGPSTVVFYE